MTVRFANKFGDIYEPATIDAFGENVRLLSTPNYLFSAKESIDITKVAVGLNGQQFIDAGTIALKLPKACHAIKEDFDYIDNIDGGSMSIASDAFNAFGAHHSYWSSIIGGRTVDACFVDDDNTYVHKSYKYQHLMFDGNITDENFTRVLETVSLDTSMSYSDSRNSFNVSFNLTFLDAAYLEGEDTSTAPLYGVGGRSCSVRRPVEDGYVVNPVDFEASTDGGASWILLARFGNGSTPQRSTGAAAGSSASASAAAAVAAAYGTAAAVVAAASASASQAAAGTRSRRAVGASWAEVAVVDRQEK